MGRERGPRHPKPSSSSTASECRGRAKRLGVIKAEEKPGVLVGRPLTVMTWVMTWVMTLCFAIASADALVAAVATLARWR